MLNEIYHAISPVAFQIGPFQARWYGIAYLLGFILAGIVFYRTARRWKFTLSIDYVMVLVLSVAVGIIVGARLFYVLFYGLAYYLQNPGHILNFAEGGMSFHGGLVGGLVGGAICCRVLKLSFSTVLDMFVVGAPLGLFLGRVANFINGELWGKPTDLPWGVIFETGGNVARHPSQLYEALLEGLLIFVVLYFLSRRKRPLYRGCYAGIFLVLYGFFRFLVEFVRVPDVQLGYLSGWLTMGQLLSIPVFAAGVLILVLACKRKSPQALMVQAESAQNPHAKSTAQLKTAGTATTRKRPTRRSKQGRK